MDLFECAVRVPLRLEETNGRQSHSYVGLENVLSLIDKLLQRLTIALLQNLENSFSDAYVVTKAMAPKGGQS